MRTILRVGITVGAIAFVVLYPLQSVIGLAAAAGIVLAGLAAGLGAAKWLPRSWYGRQFGAGLRTVGIAVCMAGASVLLAAFNQGPSSVTLLVDTSRLLGLDLRPLISHLASVGWIGTTIALVASAMLVGIVLGVLATLLGAVGKNRHAIQVVNQARLAAQAGLQGDTAVPSSAASGWTAQSSPGLQASSPGLQPEPIRANPSQFPQAEPSWATPSSPGQRQKPAPAELPPFQKTEPALPAAVGRPPSNVRPADSQLTEAMREALATWAAENVATGQSDSATAEPEEASGKARAPQPSAYLNSTPPAPSKRARKKQNTEWIR